MDNIKCKLCAGSSDIELYEIELNDNQKQFLNRQDNIKTDLCIGKESGNQIEH